MSVPVHPRRVAIGAGLVVALYVVMTFAVRIPAARIAASAEGA